MFLNLWDDLEMNWFTATILGLVEGITEYLPISSTGHLILTAKLFGINEDAYVKSFNIVIQAGAIAAVLVLYWKRFSSANKEFYARITIAFVPAAFLGLLVKKKIDALLGSDHVVAWALLLGGLVLIAMDWYEKGRKPSTTIDQISLKSCFIIGLIQCIAFIPGVSRAAATMLGGSYMGLSKKEAAEFSFFLAVPTLMGASVVKGAGIIKTISSDQILFLVYGTFLSFVVAVLAIQTFLRLLTRVGYSGFGIYRVILGVAVLALM
jgi:undecaprenyl-diphosphatase